MTKRTVLIALACPLLALASSCSGSAAPDRNAATANAPTAAPAAKGVSDKDSNELISWSLDLPAEIAAIPALAKSIADPAIAARKQLEAEAKSTLPERKKMGAPTNPYELTTTAAVVGSPPRLLSVAVTSYQFSGGAHGMSGVSPVLWDRDESRPIEFAALFPGGLAALGSAFRATYCKALDAERAKRRSGIPPGAMADDPFSQCPEWKELAFIPQGAPGQALSRIVVHADAYVAGPYVEGAYDIELPVTQALIAAMDPAYRSSFSAAQPQ